MIVIYYYYYYYYLLLLLLIIINYIDYIIIISIVVVIIILCTYLYMKVRSFLGSVWFSCSLFHAACGRTGAMRRLLAMKFLALLQLAFSAKHLVCIDRTKPAARARGTLLGFAIH